VLREGAVLDGKYQIDRRLAEGGMGVVFVAQHLFLKKPVAVKVLHPSLGGHPEAVERFSVEARAASLIDHENVVRVSDFGKSGDQLYLVMELLEGNDLATELEAGRLSVTRARFIACQILRGLRAAHGQGVIHRDLKPENVFLARRPDGDVVKILDFGIARMRPEPESNLRLTKEGALMGTPLYMAPEQMRGRRQVDARSDLYSVGVMLYEMLAGEPPYSGSSFSELAHAVLQGRPRPLANVDAVLAALVMKAFAGDPAARFQSAEEMLGALERHRLDEPPAPPRLGELGSADRPTVRDRSPMTLAATLDGKTPPPGTFAPPEEPALELDRPPPEPPLPEPPPARSRAWLVTLPVLLLCAAGIYFLVARSTATPVTVRIVDLPRGAQVFVDGQRSASTFRLPGDRRQHRVRLEAPGYTDKGLFFVADDNQQLDGQMKVEMKRRP
jgi:serine/threonine-protein kinase